MAKSKNKKRSITQLSSKLKIFSASEDSFDLIKEGEKIQSGFLGNTEKAQFIVSNSKDAAVALEDEIVLPEIEYSQPEVPEAMEEKQNVVISGLSPAMQKYLENAPQRLEEMKRKREILALKHATLLKNQAEIRKFTIVPTVPKEPNISFKKFHESFEDLIKKLKEEESPFTIDAKSFNFCLEELESPAACVLYIYLNRLAKLYGENGESISVSLSSLAKALKFSKGTIRSALKKLEEYAMVKSENLISSNIYTIYLQSVQDSINKGL